MQPFNDWVENVLVADFTKLYTWPIHHCRQIVSTDAENLFFSSPQISKGIRPVVFKAVLWANLCP